MFVHFNNHSDYSLRHSISTIDKIVERVCELEQESVAIADEGNLFGAVEFTKKCREQNIKPIIGCELQINDEQETDSKNKNSSKVLLYAKDTQGFENLKRLSSRAYTEHFYYYPRTTFQDIEEFHQGLFCILPQRGSRVERLLEISDAKQSSELISRYKDVFAERFLLEIQNHGIAIEEQYNIKIAALGKEHGVPLIAGNACYYPREDDARAHEIYTQNDRINSPNLPNHQFYIKSAKEMHAAFPNFPDALQKTLELAQECTFEMEFIGPKLPEFIIPEHFKNQEEYLRHLTMQGLKSRYPTITEEIEKRVKYELDCIISMGFSGYILIIWDIIRYVKDNTIPVGPGRGSVAGSLVSYALGISGVDPMRYGLLFERFLNPERVSMPDIDSDFCFEKRQLIINYIRNKYGEDHCGQIITFSSLKPRGAVRDVGRALEIPLQSVDEIAKLLPVEADTIEKAKEMEPRLTHFKTQEFDQLFEITEKLLGIKRHASIHAAGIVIGSKKLIHFAPLYKDQSTGTIATQYSMNYLEICGLVKMDILGLRTVTVISNAEKLVQEEHPEFSIQDIPYEDPEVYSMLSQGKSDGIFQFDSEGMQRVLQTVQPKRIEELIALNALYRPGPMRFIEQYAKTKQGEQRPEYLHASMEAILKETYGVIVYQEQVMQIAREIAGFSLGAADVLRKVMGKKQKKEMGKLEEQFIDGASEKGIEPSVSRKIFELLVPFAGYGFNKSHAAAYAELAYQTAYLKCKHPLQFIVASLNSVHSKPDELTRLLQLCKDMRIEVRGPDINKSDYDFKTEDVAIRYGLCAIKNLSDDVKKHLAEERTKEGGDYTSIFDTLLRLQNKNDVKRLVEMGAPSGLFDSLFENRALLVANMENILQEGKQRLEAKHSQQTLLFVESDTKKDIASLLTNKALEEVKLMELEREYLSTYINFHPLDEVKKHWIENTSLNLGTFKEKQYVEYQKEPHHLVAYTDAFGSKIKKNKKIYFGTLHDYNGSVRFLFTTDSNREIQIPKRKPYGFVGFLLYRDKTFTFMIDQTMSIEDLIRKRKNDYDAPLPLYDGITRRMVIELKEHPSNDDLVRLKSTLLTHFGDASVKLLVPKEGGSFVSVRLPRGFTVNADSPELLEALEKNDIISRIT